MTTSGNPGGWRDPTAAPPGPALVALVGNPNTGKTTLFNALTGFRRHVANYPGVTVEIARGPVRNTARRLELLDLPGTYSLAAASPDELVVTNVLFGRRTDEPRPDVILAILDASNLPRNLYLLSQLLETGLPVVVALNMIDVARGRGLSVDAEKLAQRLGVPVIPIVATDERTIRPLMAQLERPLEPPRPEAQPVLQKELADEANRICGAAGGQVTPAEAFRLLLDDAPPPTAGRLAPDVLAAARARLAAAGVDASTEVRSRYAWITGVVDGVITRPDRAVVTWSDRIDRVLTHRLGGAIVLLGVLFVLFQAIFKWARPLMVWIGQQFGALGELVGASLPAGALQSFVVDGVIAGIGSVVVFLPQILILFLFIAVLEDCGYMARAAFMMDRLMRVIGLSGRAMIPLLSGFACAIPAIMGTRVIADRRERFVTIMIIPFMSCSARLPVYVLMIGAMVPAISWLGGWVGLQGLVLLGMYLVGVVVAIPVAWALKKTAFAGPASGFLLELPGYKWPRPRAIWQRMFFAGKSFLLRAGTVILAVNLLVWALGYFPRTAATQAKVERVRAAQGWSDAQFEGALAGAYLRDSYLGRMGRAIEPAIAPLGWDWRIGVSVIASFPAREVIVASLGTIFNLGSAGAEDTSSLQEALCAAANDRTGRPLFTLSVALSIMVFFALCAQCGSTLVMIGREMGSWVWPAISFVGMTTIAYVAAWGVAVVTRALGG